MLEISRKGAECNVAFYHLFYLLTGLGLCCGMSALHLCHVGFLVVGRGLSCPSACGILVHQFSSVTQSCPVLCDPMDCSQASLSITNSWSLLTPISIELVRPSNHLVLCRPLLLLPSILPSIRVFSSELGSLHQVAKVLECQLQHHSFQ